MTKFAGLFAQAPTLPRLRRCSITFLCSRFSEYNRPIQTTFASFLNSLQDTLQHLALHYKPMQDSSVLLGHLVIFKSLSSFEIDCSLYYNHNLDDCNPMLGTAFIQRNALTLRELHISTSLPSGPLSSLSLPEPPILLSVCRSHGKLLGSHAFLSQNPLESLTISGFIAPAKVRNILTSITYRNSCCTFSRL